MSKLCPKLVGAKIKELRLSVNETQEEFAEHINRTVETVSNIEAYEIMHLKGFPSFQIGNKLYVE